MPIIDTGRTFEIYSIGDGLFMRRIIDSISAMNNAGVLLDLVALSMMLGLLIMAFRNVAAGGSKLDLGSTLVSLILGVTLFGMKATVVIHDMNYAPGEVDQPSYVVDNVPFGVAAAGYIISGIGYELTLKMEQGYGLYSGSRSSMIEGGFGNTLSWINQLRAWENPMFTDGGSGDAARFRENMTEYMKSCVLPGVEMGHLSLPQILSTTNIWSEGTPTSGGIGYPSVWLSTKYRSSGGSPQSVTCEYAWEHLDAEHDVVFDAYANALAKSQLGQSTSGQDVETALSEAYDSIGVSTSQMQELVVAGAVGVSLELALKGRDSASLEANSKLMIEQAAMQRSVQWAAEETMFRRIMRPMMAFFESLMYALAPFMALAIGLGSYGIQTVGKYLMLSIWVALWMPVLSIIELYQVTMMQHAVNAMMHGLDGYQTINGISIAGSNELRSQAIEWLSTGAAMAAFTPAITMALVWGGAITASSLANQIRGADTINEKVSAPDIVNPSAATNVGPRHEHSAFGGGHMGGAGGAIPTINVGQGVTESIQSAQRAYQSASQQMAAMESEQISRTLAAGGNVAASSRIEDAGSTSAKDFGRASTGRTETDSKDQRVDNAVAVTDSQAVTQTFGGGLGASADASSSRGGGGNGGGAKSGGKFAFLFNAGGSSDEAHKTDDSIRLADGRGTGSGKSASVEKGHQFESGQVHSEANALSAQQVLEAKDSLSHNENYTRQKALMKAAEDSITRLAGLQNTNGVTQSVSVGALAQNAIKSGAAANYDGLVKDAGLTDVANREATRMRQLGMSGEQAKVAGQILALHQGAMQGTAFGASNEQAVQRAAAYAEAMQGNLLPGQVYQGASRPTSNAEMEGRVRSAVPTEKEMERVTAGATGGSGVNAGALAAKVTAGMSGDRSALGTLQQMTNEAVGANPTAFGSHPAGAGMNPGGSADTVGEPMLAGVKAEGAAAQAAAVRGTSEAAFNQAADWTTLDGYGRLMLNSANPSEVNAGTHSAELARMNNALMQEHPWLSYAAANMLNVPKMLESHGDWAPSAGQVKAAQSFAETPEGSAILDLYGDKMAGAHRMAVADRIHADSANKGTDAGKMPHEHLMEERQAIEARKSDTYGD
jgi:hypothetical protein